MDVFKYLSDSIATIKRLGAILCGDEAGDGQYWQRDALAQAHELRHYAEMLERIAAGKEGGGIVFPSWDEGVDGVDESSALLAACQKMIAADNDNDEVGKSLAILAIRRAVDDAESGDGVDSPVSPEEIRGVPKSGVMPEWCQEDIAESMAGGATATAALRAGEIYRRYLVLKGALATALMRLSEGAETLDRVAGRLGRGAVPLEVAAGMREAFAAGIAAIEGVRQDS